MNSGQTLFLLLFACYAVVGLVWGLCQSRQGNTNSETPGLWLLGAFVWADAVVFGLFWLLVMGMIWLLNDWLLFWIVIAVFWVVRSGGEVIYWFNEQFAVKHRNPAKKFWIYRFFPNDSVWFVFQIYWQCLLVISIIFSIYLFALWLPMIV
jgi:hypothetical protein